MFKVSVAGILKTVRWGVILFGPSIMSGQSATAKPEKAGSSYKPHMTFDVASIREYRADGGTRYIENMPHNSYYHADGGLLGLILNAYDLHIVPQLENLPHWGFETMYTINAKSDAATDEALERLSDSDALAEKRHMLQVLLAERFKLKIHPETRISTTYELVATPRAAKLMTPVQGDVGKTINSCTPSHFSKKGLEIESKGCPFSYFFSDLQQMMGTNVVDHTGMTGMYAYHLMHRPPTWPLHPDEEQYPDTVDAVREQLGLELKQTKGPVTFWVVDHVEKPTPN